ncbi:MAG: DUF429 domain-containing protein [Haloarculaceae archaeon]
MGLHGVDFSGASEPGESVWLTTAEPTDDGVEVTACRSAREAFGVSDRDEVLASLRSFPEEGDVMGVDASFGLPRPVLPERVAASDDWREAVRWVAGEYADADALAAQADWKDRARASEADGIELKRRTDGSTGANSPYSFITRYQTFHAMRDLLAPVLDSVSVPPMIPGDDRGPTLIEVYPAATLRSLGVPDRKYKDSSDPRARERRERILAGLCEWGVTLPERFEERVLGDADGDALDSLVAAVATARAVESRFAVEDGRYDPVEGYIYV